MIAFQYRTFKHQSVISLCTYIPALLVAVYKVNFNKDWVYDPNVIMDNQEFNMAVGVTMVMGILSYGLSLNPSWFKILLKCAKAVEQSE